MPFATEHVWAGDAVRLLEGYGVVEAVRDTGRWERVYNGRVTEYHTYFVGCDDWGFAVWVHNAECSVWSSPRKTDSQLVS